MSLYELYCSLHIHRQAQTGAVHGLPDSVVTNNGPTLTIEPLGEFMQHYRNTPFFSPSQMAEAELRSEGKPEVDDRRFSEHEAFNFSDQIPASLP